MLAAATKLKTAIAVQNYRHQAATNLKVTYEYSPSCLKKNKLQAATKNKPNAAMNKTV
jgi:hypothetical protein